jgi:DNA-binding NarL/FixJ family response regulator
MRILIADDQDRVRFALRVLLTQQPALQVVGEAAHGAALLAQARVTAPDLALLDWELPGLVEAGGLDVLRKTVPQIRVVALSSRIGARSEALAAGADAFVSKGDPPERLLAAVRGCGAAAG